MAKYLIRWDAGYGESYRVVDADTHLDAYMEAEQECKDEAEASMFYEACKLTPELIEEYNLDT